MKLSFMIAALIRGSSIGAASIALYGCANTPLRAHADPAYDFEYVSSGEASVRPTQVFDDGTKTYFQFRIGQTIPVIQIEDAGKRRLIVASEEGIYYTIPALAKRYVFQRGQTTAVTEYQGKKQHATDYSQLTASTPVQAPKVDYDALYAISQTGRPKYVKQMIDGNSYAVPIRGDNVSWAVALPTTEKYEVRFKEGGAVLMPVAKFKAAEILSAGRNAAQVMVVGRDDDSMKETLAEKRAAAVKDWLIKNGVPGEVISTTVDTSGAMGLDAQVRVVSRAGQRPVAYASADAPAFRADAVQAAVGSGAMSREDGAKALAGIVGYGKTPQAPSASGTASIKTTLGVFAEREGYILNWADGTADTRVAVPSIDRQPSFDKKVVELEKATSGPFNLGVDHETKHLYAAPAVASLALVTAKANVSSLTEKDGTLKVHMLASPKSLYVINAATDADVAVQWQGPTEFTVPAQKTLRIVLDGKTLDLTRLERERYVVAYQPQNGTTTK